MSVTPDYYEGKIALLASIHKKEEIIAPLFLEKIGCIVEAVPADTDRFGTFSGEVERSFSPLETARMKAQQAFTLREATLSIASEGSFGPHPAISFLPSDHELVLLLDVAHTTEYMGFALSTSTNFGREKVTSRDNLMEFALRSLFPTHALLLKGINNNGEIEAMEKGIHDRRVLLESFDHMSKAGWSVEAETDMRAMHNPTRMKVIGEATLDLLNKLLVTCPQCRGAGFGIVETLAGLPCEWCRTPTKLSMTAIHRCRWCRHEEQRPASDKEWADPMYCEHCNP
jgi:hypothetical protein